MDKKKKELMEHMNKNKKNNEFQKANKHGKSSSINTSTHRTTNK